MPTEPHAVSKSDDAGKIANGSSISVQRVNAHRQPQQEREKKSKYRTPTASADPCGMLSGKVNAPVSPNNTDEANPGGHIRAAGQRRRRLVARRHSIGEGGWRIQPQGEEVWMEKEVGGTSRPQWRLLTSPSPAGRASSMGCRSRGARARAGADVQCAPQAWKP
jgi:hypothetical protein